MSGLLAITISSEAAEQYARTVSDYTDEARVSIPTPQSSTRSSLNVSRSSLSRVRESVEETDSSLTKGRLVILLAALAGIQFTASFCNAILGIGAPAIGKDLGLDAGLLLWPVSAFFLSCGSLLLLAGAIADVLGHSKINIIGCFLSAIMTLCCGWAQTGVQLIVLRAMSGLGFALCSPTSVAIIANNFPSGKGRNIAFSCLGFSAPLGFSLGLILGGLLLAGPGWRAGIWLCGALNMALFAIVSYVLPRDSTAAVTPNMTTTELIRENLQLLAKRIDWLGAMLACSSLAMLSYSLAYISQDIHNIKQASTIAILSISLLLIPIFLVWQNRQERLHQPALIPNSIWKNKIFSSVCLIVLFSYAVSNVMELFCNLFFQEVQGLTALESSARIVPSLVVGVCVQIATGFFIHQISPFYLVMGALILSAGAPLLMANTNPVWPYWYTAFPAQVLAPISVDIIFTIGLLVISAAFPQDTQALAGAVFNTVAQFGSSLGLTVMQAVSSTATELSEFVDKESPSALEVGYKASFWAAFGSMLFAAIVGLVGMRRMQRIGLKQD